MAHSLANETLHSILNIAFCIEDDHFVGRGTLNGPFANVQYSTADLLLVCKRWMRVATPLLFETVIIRSAAQAQALAKALKKNKQFGGMIKKARIEGGYGVATKNILELAPNIDSLCISLCYASSDNARPMFNVLSTLRLKRLALCNLDLESNASNAQISYAREKLRLCLSGWTYLVESVAGVKCGLRADAPADQRDISQRISFGHFYALLCWCHHVGHPNILGRKRA